MDEVMEKRVTELTLNGQQKNIQKKRTIQKIIKLNNSLTIKRMTQFLGMFLILSAFSFKAHALEESITNQKTAAIANVEKKNQADEKSKTEPDILTKIKTLRKNNNLESAKVLAIEFLKTHPDDVDVMLLLGLIYYQMSQYDKAENFLKKVLKKTPTYLDAKLGLIRIKIAQAKYEEASQLIKEVVKVSPDNEEVKQIQTSYKKAIAAKEKEDKVKKIKETKIKKKKETKIKKKKPSLIDQAIEKGNLYCALVMIDGETRCRPCDPDLIAAKAKIFFKLHLYGRSAYLAKKVLAIDPAHASAKELLSNIKEISPHKIFGVNEIGISTLNERVSDLNETWNYSTLYYARETRAGLLYLKVNYAKRLGERGKQGEIEFLPVVNQYFYFDLFANFARKPELFPQYSGAIEGYLSIPKFPTLSFGPYFAHIVGSTFYRKYTASLSKDINKYWLSIRANHYVPNKGTPSTLYLATIRRYSTTNDFYVNLSLGYGTSPDLSDLQTLDFIVIRNKIVTLGLRFPIFNHATLVDVGVDYQHWRYPSGLVRILRGFNIGFNYQFQEC